MPSQTPTNKIITLLGASSNPERYSYLALKKLQNKNREFQLINPNVSVIENFKVYPDLSSLPKKPGILSVYLSPALSTPLIEEILESNPELVILNPGSENPQLEEELKRKSIPFEKACTLVLLDTGQMP